MKAEKTYPKYWLFLLLTATAAMALLLFAGPARAHVEAAYHGDITLEYDGNANQVYLLSAAKDEEGNLFVGQDGNLSSSFGWEAVLTEDGGEIPNSYSVTFLLANTNNKKQTPAYRQTAKLALVATAGIADPTSLDIVLSCGGSNYTASPTEIQAGSAWYREYGPGWIYRFYNSAGEELSWMLQERIFASHEMTMIVIGTSQTAAALTLIASAEMIA